jgi:transcriptional regulator of acetoin/glycerol metabolism
MTLREAIHSAAQGYLYRTLSECRGNVTQAAKRAGYPRQMFYKVLRRYGVIQGRMRPDSGATHTL